MEDKKLKKCGHNPWDVYGLNSLRSRLNWIKASNPKIYKIYDEKGNPDKGVGEHYQDEINDARKRGLKVELRDNSMLIKELEASIKGVEQRIEEHKKNCKA